MDILRWDAWSKSYCRLSVSLQNNCWACANAISISTNRKYLIGQYWNTKHFPSCKYHIVVSYSIHSKSKTAKILEQTCHLKQTGFIFKELLFHLYFTVLYNRPVMGECLGKQNKKFLFHFSLVWPESVQWKPPPPDEILATPLLLTRYCKRPMMKNSCSGHSSCLTMQLSDCLVGC